MAWLLIILTGILYFAKRHSVWGVLKSFLLKFGGTDNIGGAQSFTPGKKSGPNDVAHAPPEKMTEKRQNTDSNSADHPAPHNTD